MSISEIKDLQGVIKDCIKGEVVDQKIKRLTEPGENYGSIMLKVDFKVKNGDKEDTYHAVAKCIPPSKSTQRHFNTAGTFPAEIGWYSDLIPTLKSFQKKNGVKNLIDCFCNYYGSRLALDPSKKFDEHGLILLENLMESDIYVPLCDFIAQHPKVAHLVGKVREECKFFPFGRQGKSEPWSTTLHSDFWTNNMMVKDGDPPKVKIVDLQTTCYGTCTNDIVFFLSTSPQTDLVRDHLDQFLKVYFDEFVRVLEELDVDISLFSYNDFLNEVNVEGKKLLSKSMFFVTVCNAEKGASDDVSNEDYDHHDNLKRMCLNLNKTEKEKLVFLVELYEKRNWI